MNATVSRTEQGDVLELCGSADYQATAELRKAFEAAIEATGGRVICDLSKVDFVCSDALSVFICARVTAIAMDGYVRFVRPQRRVAEVLETTHLDRIFGVFDSVEKARAAD